MRRTDSTKFMGPTQIPSARVCAFLLPSDVVLSILENIHHKLCDAHSHTHTRARALHNYPRCVVDKFQAGWQTIGFAAQLFGCLRVADIRMHMV